MPDSSSGRLRSVLLLVLLAGCAGVRGSRGHPDARASGRKLDLTELSAQSQAYVQRQEEALWNAWTRGQPPSFEPLIRETEHVFHADAVRTVSAALGKTTDAESRKRLSHLRAFLVGEHLARMTRDESVALAKKEGALTFSVGKRTYAFQTLPLLLSNEPNRERRRALFEAAMQQVPALTPALEAQRAEIGRVLRTVGYASTLDYVAELRQRDVASLEATAEQFLRDSQSLFEQALDRLSQKELNLPRHALSVADFPRLFRPDPFDDAFPREQQHARIMRTAGQLGFELDAVPGLRVDAESRPGKQARALCLAPTVPGDVRLSLNPGGGFAGELGAMQELGHCLYFSHVDARPFETAKLGPSTTAQTYGVLFRDLLANRQWLQLERKVSGKRVERHLARLATYRLFELRREAARILHAIHAERAPSNARASYQALMTRALAVTVDAAAAAAFEKERDLLLSVSPGFESFLLAGQLRQSLEQRFGEHWWTQLEAGAFLRELFAHGNALSPEQWLARVGAEKLDSTPAREGLATQLGEPLLKTSSPSGPAIEERTW